MIKPIVHAIRNGSVSENRGEAPSTGLEQVVAATNIEEALVFDGESSAVAELRTASASPGPYWFSSSV